MSRRRNAGSASLTGRFLRNGRGRRRRGRDLRVRMLVVGGAAAIDVYARQSR